jgi:hypothetical protein
MISFSLHKNKVMAPTRTLQSPPAVASLPFGPGSKWAEYMGCLSCQWICSGCLRIGIEQEQRLILEVAECNSEVFLQTALALQQQPCIPRRSTHTLTFIVLCYGCGDDETNNAAMEG